MICKFVELQGRKFFFVVSENLLSKATDWRKPLNFLLQANYKSEIYINVLV